jgi:uncharacterized protein
MPTSNSTHERFRSSYGPWAVVTGASSGIGKALATELAARGFNLVLVARDVAALGTLAGELSLHGVACRVLDLDLSTEASPWALEEATRELDVGLFVASAGFGTSGPFLENTLDAELGMLHVNARAVVVSTWLFGKRFAARGRGGIILLSSIVGFQGMPWASHYAATKAYVQTFAEGLRVEWASKGIDVLAAAPGPTASGFAARAGMTMGKAMHPWAIAKPILDSLGRRGTILPGFLSKLLVYSLIPLPRWARVRLMGRVMKGMTAVRNR